MKSFKKHKGSDHHSNNNKHSKHHKKISLKDSISRNKYSKIQDRFNDQSFNGDDGDDEWHEYSEMYNYQGSRKRSKLL